MHLAAMDEVIGCLALQNQRQSHSSFGDFSPMHPES